MLGAAFKIRSSLKTGLADLISILWKQRDYGKSKGTLFSWSFLLLHIISAYIFHFKIEFCFLQFAPKIIFKHFSSPFKNDCLGTRYFSISLKYSYSLIENCLSKAWQIYTKIECIECFWNSIPWNSICILMHMGNVAMYTSSIM